MFTIGCSNGSLDDLFAEIRRFGINALADVRSTPYSAYTPQFNRENLAEACRKEGVAYVYLGDEFGAMRTKPEPMSDGTVSAPVTDGIVDFTKVRQTEAFQRGVERVSRGLSKGLRIALMCTELEPERCHRAVMVSPVLLTLSEDTVLILASRSPPSSAREITSMSASDSLFFVTDPSVS